MESFSQSARRRDDGEALPTVFRSLANRDIHYYRGSVHVTAAAPGVGKSIFALRHAIGVKVPTLYICADTPRHVTVTRASQMITGDRKDVVEARLEDQESALFEELKSVDHIGAFYRSGIDANDILMMIGAFAEIMGEFPHLVILDNLINVAVDGDSPYNAQMELMQDLDTIAKEGNICIHILVHVSGHYKNGTTPIPQDGVMNKLSEFQHTTLTLTRPGDGDDTHLLVACVKNRTGPSDMSGETRYELTIDFEAMQLEDS